MDAPLSVATYNPLAATRNGRLYHSLTEIKADILLLSGTQIKQNALSSERYVTFWEKNFFGGGRGECRRGYLGDVENNVVNSMDHDEYGEMLCFAC